MSSRERWASEFLSEAMNEADSEPQAVKTEVEPSRRVQNYLATWGMENGEARSPRVKNLIHVWSAIGPVDQVYEKYGENTIRSMYLRTMMQRNNGKGKPFY